MAGFRFLLLVFVFLVGFCSAHNWTSKRPKHVKSTPLDDYVNAPDDTYNFTIAGNIQGEGWVGYNIRMISQTWDVEVDRQVWEHNQVIIVPHDRIDTDVGMIYMTGGSNTSPFPSPDSGDLALAIEIAVQTGIVTSVLFQIPNQPIVYDNDPEQQPRTEDDFIAYGWRLFIEQGEDPMWLARFPMTKAGVRGLDTISTFMGALGINVNQFIVSGASKRGWAAWTLAAVDKRVVGLAPLVLSSLNIVENLHHHYQMLGGWSFAFADYLANGVTGYIDDPRTQRLADIVDPFSFRERYAQFPVMLSSAAGDQFFMPDDSRYFLDQMPETVRIRNIANCEHSMATCTESVLIGMVGFVNSIVHPEVERPDFDWTLFPEQGAITLTSRTPVLDARMWTAVSATGGRKDFRLMRLGPDGPVLQLVFWNSTQLQPTAEGSYTAAVEIPTNGRYNGVWIEVDYESYDGSIQQYTTDVLMVPDDFPFPDCSGQDCTGTLV